MHAVRLCLAAALVGLAAHTPLRAESFASSASSAGSASLGSSSDSVQGSSNSSSRPAQVAQGDYRIVQIVALGDAAGRLRVTLQAVDGDAAQDFALLLPPAAAATGQLAVGGVVSATDRPYGTELRSAATNAAFFLVVADDWHAELQSRAI
jgi:hypothetical protein